METPSLTVIDPGPLATIQDLGRRGYLMYGVSQCGAMDEVAIRIANLLVGNTPDESAIEFTWVGGVYRVDAESCHLAITGGEFPVMIDGQPANPYEGHTLGRGSRIEIGRVRSGARGYLAVTGGFALEPALGSRSTHVRSALGGVDGGPLTSGTSIPLNRPMVPAEAGVVLDHEYWPRSDGAIRVVLGPQDDYFTEAGIRTFLTSEYRVSPQSDRMGYRFDGPTIEFKDDYNIVSDGIAIGSVQVVGEGRPIVLLADRQTTGGYPKIATIASADLPRLAQRRPGDRVRFAAISVEEAEELRAGMLRRVDGLRRLFRPVGSGLIDPRRLMMVNLIDGAVAPHQY